MSLDELEERFSDERVKFVAKKGEIQFSRPPCTDPFRSSLLMCRTGWQQSWKCVICEAEAEYF